MDVAVKALGIDTLNAHSLIDERANGTRINSTFGIVSGSDAILVLCHIDVDTILKEVLVEHLIEGRNGKNIRRIVGIMTSNNHASLIINIPSRGKLCESYWVI